MDKYEYKVRAEEIEKLIKEGSYKEAVEIADQIDWTRIRSVPMLCKISDLYKINHRYEDARNLMRIADERRPDDRRIVRALCELSIKLEDHVQAIAYCKQFVRLAPRDLNRYVLQYKIYCAEDVGLEERIEVLEELKSKERREKWMYELAYLYHRVGLATRCVEECDELILWFGEGKYVIKAMELKMLHQPLTSDQQEKYDKRFEAVAEEAQAEETPAAAPDAEAQAQADAAVAAKELAEAPAEQDAAVAYGAAAEASEQAAYEETAHEDAVYEEGTYEDAAYEEAAEADVSEEGYAEEVYQGETYNTGIFAAAEEEIAEEAPAYEAANNTQELFAQDGVYLSEEALGETRAYEPVRAPFYGVDADDIEIKTMGNPYDTINLQAELAAGIREFLDDEDVTATDIYAAAETDMAEIFPKDSIYAQPPKEMADVIAQDPDGQMRLIVPQAEPVAHTAQITGQMSIDDILAEWEQKKQDNAARHQQLLREKIMNQTGAMFTEFDEAVRDGLLEQLEKTAAEEALAEQQALEEPALDAQEAEAVAESEEDGIDFLDAEEEAEMPLDAAEEPLVVPEGGIDYDAAEGFLDDGPAEEDLQDALQETDASEEGQETEEILWEVDETAPEEEEAPLVEEGNIAYEEAYEEAEAEDGEADEAVALAIEEEETYDAFDEMAPLEDAPEEELKEDAAEETPKEDTGRDLTAEEKELYEPFTQSKSSRKQLAKALDSITLAAYTGNVIITGEEGMDTMGLAKSMVQEIQANDSNFSGRVAKISGEGLNERNLEETLESFKNGALIVQKASGINAETAAELQKLLQTENLGIIVFLEDTKRNMNKFLGEQEYLLDCFNARMDMEALSDEKLVAYGKKYARELEYSISDLGILELHTRIDEMQTNDHVVTVIDVRDLIDEAIESANRKSIGHFFDILLSKRYDSEDMIVLTEKDFA